MPEIQDFGLYLVMPTGLWKSECWKRGSTWILDARVGLVEEPKNSHGPSNSQVMCSDLSGDGEEAQEQRSSNTA